ncbi:putative DUF1579 family protein [Gammaproteobacteria bacterium]
MTSEQMQKLEKFIGSWAGTEDISHTLWRNRSSNVTAIRIDNRMAIGGKFLIQDYIQEYLGAIRYQWHAVVGWNPGHRCFTMHLFDSAGLVLDPPLLGNFEEEVLTLHHRGRMGHFLVMHHILETGDYALRVDVSPDEGKWYTAIEGHYARVEEKGI